jgi:hypothetical protein
MPNEAPIGAQFQLLFQPAFREYVPATSAPKPDCNRGCRAMGPRRGRMMSHLMKIRCAGRGARAAESDSLLMN